MANHEPTIVAKSKQSKIGANMQSRERMFSHRSDSGIRIFDPYTIRGYSCEQNYGRF